MFSRKISFRSNNLRRLAVCLLTCFIVFMLFSVVQAKPNGHGNSHNTNPLGTINPAGIIIGSGGLKPNPLLTNLQVGGASIPGGGGSAVPKGGGAQTKGGGKGVGLSSSGYSVGGDFFVVQGGSNIVVQQAFSHHNSKAKGKAFLASGDIFSDAIEGIDSLASSLETEDTIGAKGPNPGKGLENKEHSHWGNGFNPGGGGGSDKPGQAGTDPDAHSGWGSGNNGQGVGNTWVGNQGRGNGAGMAGGSKGDGDNGDNDDDNNDDDNDDGNDEATIAAPLWKFEEFKVGGCPALMKWLVKELGTSTIDIRIYVARTLALSSDIHPCEACSRLQEAALVLGDVDKQYINAIAEVVNEFVAPDAPISEEQMALIAATFSEHIDDGTQYAVAGEYINALAEYIGIITEEIGWSSDYATAFVMDKYGTAITESGDANLTAYVMAQLASFGG